jgi:DNA-binding FrmR family transcriptional regulator
MDNPCHRDRIANLKRIEGQIRGIIAMIEDKRYCIDILDQLKAVKNSISSVEHNILGKHMSACVRESFIDSKESDEKINELIKLLKR